MSGCCSADGYAFAPSWIKEEGQGSRDKAYKAMSDYMEVYDYKPETFAGIKYAFTSKSNLTGPNWLGGPRFWSEFYFNRSRIQRQMVLSASFDQIFESWTNNGPMIPEICTTELTESSTFRLDATR